MAAGGRTGRDGIHGATFSSAELTHESETRSGGAVQIGNAITEKMLLDVLLQARDVGAALVDEAAERQADLLVVGLAYRRRFGGDFAIGRTVPYVLKNAPCAVWVVREPIPEEGA